jgi:hypothetical protein
MKRDWTIPTVDADGDYVNYEAVYDAVAELTTILLRLGGVGGIAPHRVETDHGYVVDRVVFQYDSYAPGLNRRQDEPKRAKEETGPAEQDAEVIELAAVGEESNGSDTTA